MLQIVVRVLQGKEKCYKKPPSKIAIIFYLLINKAGIYVQFRHTVRESTNAFLIISSLIVGVLQLFSLKPH